MLLLLLLNQKVLPLSWTCTQGNLGALLITKSRSTLDFVTLLLLLFETKRGVLMCDGRPTSLMIFSIA